MKTGMYDVKGDFHQIDFYRVQDLCRAMVEVATSKDTKLRMDFEEHYLNKITRFSPEFEYCIHCLGWQLYDPLCLGRDEVLFSNGKRSYIASLDYVSKPGFNRLRVKNDDTGFPILTDEAIGYKASLNDLDGIEEGIVDERGYVDASFASSLTHLAALELMFDMMCDEQAYKEYMMFQQISKQNGTVPPSALQILTGKKNVIAVKKREDETYGLSFVSENDGVVQDFIDALTASGKLANMLPEMKDEGPYLPK